MSKKNETATTLNLTLDTSELSAQQIRLIKTINTMLTHVMRTLDEEEYFEGSAELMQLMANAINKANFSDVEDQIQYGLQALEFSVDMLSDQVQTGEFLKFDN